MHITIFVYGSWGDMRPHVVLGQGLQAAGHSVQVVASRTYEDWVRARGLGFSPLSVDVSAFTRDNASMMDLGLLQQLKLLRETISPLFAQIGRETLEATRDSDVLMTVELGAVLFFDILRVNPLRTILINPAPLNPTREFAMALPPAPGWFPFKGRYNRFSYSVLRRVGWSSLGNSMKVMAAELGVPKSKFRECRAFLDQTPALTAVSRHVVQRPADWAEHFQVTGYLFDDDPDWMPLPGLAEFLAAGEPPVYMGFGSMPDSKPEATTRLILDAVQQAGKRAVILTGWAGLGVDDAPGHVHILNYAPHSWLFPKMATVVHHGGSGTTAAGLRAGVPAVIVPHLGDQPFWGRRIKELEVGPGPIPRKKLTAQKLAAAIRAATESSAMRDRALALSENIKQEDGLGSAMQWVQRFLA
ncbi:MAG: glycosyltransferase family 1 protein [Anaerolineae bacterium]|nr:glycosyltransferase family 1 protein [Anaerolineae bacterium]